MCGRFALSLTTKVIEDEFGITVSPKFDYASYNISPSQIVPIVHLNDTLEKSLSMMEWGLLPSWAKDIKDTVRPINARLETVDKSPMFKSAFRKQRCLVPASGFYEWSAKTKPKQPYYFYETDRPLFAFAGLWTLWEK